MSKRTRITDLSIEEIVGGIESGDRVMMGRAITLVESKNLSHQALGDQLLSRLLLKQSKTFRLAVSGSPGVGKSTFIEALGIRLADQGKKIAVLSIDPSSDLNKGSILGDKTRMDQLSVHSNAFIRPSPAGDFLGGIAWRTREAITICEAAGYDLIIIETVGVGQSEFKVKEMVDCFLLLLTPGGGDELQGIKKGIVEIADIIAINKSDGEQEALAQRTRKEYSQALHLFPSKSNGWTPKVINTSSTTGVGLDEAWSIILKYQDQISSNGFLETNRNNQDVVWFKERVAIAIQQYINAISDNGALHKVETALREGRMDPIQATDEIKKRLFSSGMNP